MIDRMELQKYVVLLGHQVTRRWQFVRQIESSCYLMNKERKEISFLPNQQIQRYLQMLSYNLFWCSSLHQGFMTRWFKCSVEWLYRSVQLRINIAQWLRLLNCRSWVKIHLRLLYIPSSYYSFWKSYLW